MNRNDILNLKYNHPHRVVVNTACPWIPIAVIAPPTGFKVQLINARLGTSTTSIYYPGHDWTHWQGVPDWPEDIPTPDKIHIPDADDGS